MNSTGQSAPIIRKYYCKNVVRLKTDDLLNKLSGIPMSLAVDKVLRKAQSHIKAGDLTEAKQLYKQILSKFPKNKKAIQGY